MSSKIRIQLHRTHLEPFVLDKLLRAADNSEEPVLVKSTHILRIVPPRQRKRLGIDLVTISDADIPGRNIRPADLQLARSALGRVLTRPVDFQRTSNTR